MKLSDFRALIALLTQEELANLSNVSVSTIQAIEAGKSVSKLSQGKILAGLSKHVKRQVLASEINEFSKGNGYA